MFEDKQLDWFRRFTQEDMLAIGLRTALGTLGPFGAILGAFVTEFVPNQRVDRMQDFVEQMNERLTGLEEQFTARIESSPAYASLTEEVTLQAVRTPSRERRRDLAELLRTGLSQAEAQLMAHHAMLQLLEPLNDAQILILMQHGSFSQAMLDKNRADFITTHAEILRVHSPSYSDDEEAMRRWAMYTHYVDELIARGLLRDTEGTVKSGTMKNVVITRVGKLLLQAIGQPTDVNA